MKNPCIDCPDNEKDDYGYLCDLGCGKRTAWIDHQAGVREVVEWVEEHKFWFAVNGQKQWQSQLKKWGIKRVGDK